MISWSKAVDHHDIMAYMMMYASFVGKDIDPVCHSGRGSCGIPIYSLTNHTGDVMLVVIVHDASIRIHDANGASCLLIHEYRVMIEVV